MHSTRGLRQGIPLSPYLFVLGMEAFSILVSKATVGDFLSGYKMRGRNGNEVQAMHVLFAGILVFCDDSRDWLVYLNWFLIWFEALPGMRINLEKSYILPVGEVENPKLLVLELGCNLGSLPIYPAWGSL